MLGPPDGTAAPVAIGARWVLSTYGAGDGERLALVLMCNRSIPGRSGGFGLSLHTDLARPEVEAGRRCDRRPPRRGHATGRQHPGRPCAIGLNASTSAHGVCVGPDRLRSAAVTRPAASPADRLAGVTVSSYGARPRAGPRAAADGSPPLRCDAQLEQGQPRGRWLHGVATFKARRLLSAAFRHRSRSPAVPNAAFPARVPSWAAATTVWSCRS